MTVSMQLLDRLIVAASRNCDLGTLSGKVKFVRTIGKHMVGKSDLPECDHYAQRVAQMVGVPVETMADNWLVVDLLVYLLGREKAAR